MHLTLTVKVDLERVDEMDLEQKLSEWFEWFHAHPELSYEEYETTAKIKEILKDAGVEILPYSLETGLIAIVRGALEGPVQALRCDIDALPILEESGLSYASLYEGKMHACGHDFHIVAGIGCALLLQSQKESLKGAVKIIFQPAEEASIGAYKILETDVMEDVDCIWGLHADPTRDVGVMGIKEGFVTAAVDRFCITITGVSCHGAHPDDGVDPIPAGAAMVQALQTIVTRNVNAFHPALLSVTRFQAGNTWNVIPEKAELEGTVRTLEKTDRVLFEKRIREIVSGIAQAYGVKAELVWMPGPPATYNDAEMVDKATEVAKKCGLQPVVNECSMGGDDFSFYEEKIPGCYIKVGTGKGQTIHQPGFAIDQRALQKTAQYLKEVIVSNM